jgi:diguanylate cyclase (GGDEF)-like protein
MFTIVLGMHFYISFFRHQMPKLFKWCYVICIVFSLLAIFPNPYFLEKEFFVTSKYYTGLAFGPLFEAWGGWVLLLSGYCMTIITRVYLKQLRSKDGAPLGTVKLLLLATTIWAITGVLDTLTGIQAVDLPPLSWIGSFLVTCCIAWILILNIEVLYDERRQLNRDLMHDHLTQAYSRSYFEFQLEEAVSSLSRSESARLHVCIFDIDNFKSVNDHYGHINGDSLLKGISSKTKEIIRDIDCFARIGGDEFVILFAGLDDQQALDIIERIKHQIFESSFGTQPMTFKASCSFGLVSAGPEHNLIDDLSSQLMSYADEALYLAKRKGKNTVEASTIPINPC